MSLRCLLVVFVVAMSVWGRVDRRNLLLNSRFDFHAYANHRHGRAASYEADYVPHWNASGAAVLKVVRDSHIPVSVRPSVPAPNGVKLLPGGKISQFFTLPECDLISGERLSFQCHVHQDTAQAVVASIQLMKLDSEDGDWNPKKDFGLDHDRVYRRHGRGELVPVFCREATSAVLGGSVLSLEDYEIIVRYTPGLASHSSDVNTVGVKVMVENRSESPAWVFSPSLIRSRHGQSALGSYRKKPEFYRHIPRTMQKLWKGEPLHIVVMGGSIDRGSANPPMYVYDEDASSPRFKQPLCDLYEFSTSMVGLPELDRHFAYPAHFFSYGGRLKVELMKKFNYPADRMLVNFQACDGSCIGEAHSSFRHWCDLRGAPNPGMNGHKGGRSWQELYPSLFQRPEGPRPDLIIYGSGGNERTDSPDEGAVFEGALRFFQRAYPGVEFLFCVFQEYGGYTSASGDLQALALRYGIPFMDYGVIGDRLCGEAKRQTVIDWGHPQAAMHYVRFKQLERAFECSDPVAAGHPQVQLPERLFGSSYHWEGEMRGYRAPDTRLWHSRLMILDDSAFNCWGTLGGKKGAGGLYVDGRKVPVTRNYPRVDLRNSLYRQGNLSLGRRHVIEMVGEGAHFTGVDCKLLPGRRWLGVECGNWRGPERRAIEAYRSQLGFPYGHHVMALEAGEKAEISVVGTAFSVAWVDAEAGGTLKVTADERTGFVADTKMPLVLQTGEHLYVENRQAMRLGAYGVHDIEVEAQNGRVLLMGGFSYDERPNRRRERTVRGWVTAGETVVFEPPFQARPLIVGVPVRSATCAQVTFDGSGSFTAVGE